MKTNLVVFLLERYLLGSLVGLVLAVLFFLLSGCAYLSGQSPYEGDARTPVLRYVSRRYPAARGWTVDTLAIVDNPLPYAITVDVDCTLSEWRGYVIPARTSQAFLLGQEDVRCKMEVRR